MLIDDVNFYETDRRKEKEDVGRKKSLERIYMIILSIFLEFL